MYSIQHLCQVTEHLRTTLFRDLYALIDNPGRFPHTSKSFERKQRDMSATVVTGHVCDVFQDYSFQMERKCHQLPQLQAHLSILPLQILTKNYA